MRTTKRLRPWFEENPARLEFELDCLQENNWSFKIDQNAFDAGRLVLSGRVPTDEGERVLTIVFPDTYPEHRVEIYDKTGGEVLPLHQHPYGRNLCLLDNLPEAWTPNDNAAWMVERVLELNRAALEGVKGLEEIGVGAPEPQSCYYPYADNSAVVIPESVLGIQGDYGCFYLATLNREDPCRGVVSEVRSRGSSSCVLKGPNGLLELYRGPQLQGAWFRLDNHPPFLGNAEELRRWAGSTIPDFEKNLSQNSKTWNAPTGIRIVAFAFVYPDQGPDGIHDAWLIGLTEPGQRRKKKCALLRPFILSGTDQELRIASLAGLRGKRVAVVGVGTVGAPLALELAKTGLIGELLLVDYDHYTIWNLVRHPLNLHALGLNKAEAIAYQTKLYAPLLKTHTMRIRIGESVEPEVGRGVTEADLLSQLDGYDLIIDATADGGTSRFLNRFSLHSGIPLLVASVTAGAWGGEIVRSIPGATGCYECYLWHVKDDTVPTPSQDPERVQVFTRGCGFPTFAGTGFDALVLAADAARLAAQTLLRGSQGGYPDPPYDILIRHNRGASGADCPRYETARLLVHPQCAWHRARA